MSHWHAVKIKDCVLAEAKYCANAVSRQRRKMEVCQQVNNHLEQPGRSIPCTLNPIKTHSLPEILYDVGDRSDFRSCSVIGVRYYKYPGTGSRVVVEADLPTPQQPPKTPADFIIIDPARVPRRIHSIRAFHPNRGDEHHPWRSRCTPIVNMTTSTSAVKVCHNPDRGGIISTTALTHVFRTAQTRTETDAMGSIEVPHPLSSCLRFTS